MRLRAVGVGGDFLVVIRYVGAEIPPAGAPSGFDSAAMFDCIICFFCGSAAPLRMTQWVWRFVGCNLFVAMLL